MRLNVHTALLVAGLVAVAAINPAPAEAGWGAKGTANFRAGAAGERAPAKTPLPVMMVVQQDNEQKVCLSVTKSWEQNKGRVVGKAGAVWRSNASGTLVKVATFTLKKTRFKDGLSLRCKELGLLLKGDLVEIAPKFSSMRKTEAIGDKLVATLSQAPNP